MGLSPNMRVFQHVRSVFQHQTADVAAPEPRMRRLMLEHMAEWRWPAQDGDLVGMRTCVPIQCGCGSASCQAFTLAVDPFAQVTVAAESRGFSREIASGGRNASEGIGRAGNRWWCAAHKRPVVCSTKESGGVQHTRALRKERSPPQLPRAVLTWNPTPYSLNPTPYSLNRCSYTLKPKA